MDYYRIHFRSSAERDIRKIDKHNIPRILESVKALSKQPLPSQSVKLVNTNSCYRIRVGDYRVIYRIDTQERVVIIEHVRHRRHAYRKL